MRVPKILVVLPLLGATTCGEEIKQPLEFPHEKHAKAGVGCGDCHKYYSTQPYSGLPAIDDCMECHEEPLTKSPVEKQLIQMAKEKKKLVWKRLFHVPDHVYYSHRRHVVLGKLECKNCHDGMGQTATPPGAPPVDITMDFCLDCHNQMGVPVDCITCHR